MVLSVLILSLLINFQCLGQEDAQQILNAASVLLRGETSAFYHFDITVEKPDWSMHSAVKVYMKGSEKSFGYFLSPPEDKNTAYLRIGDKMWTYVPHMRQIVLMPPGMMQQGIMGGNFSSADLIRVSCLGDIYTPSIAANETIDGEDMVVLELTPKDTARNVHNKLKLWVTKKGSIPFKLEYYDKNGDLKKALTYTERKPMGGRTIPVHWEMVSAKSPPIKTILTVSDARFNIPMDDAVFTKENLTTLSHLPVIPPAASSE